MVRSSTVGEAISRESAYGEMRLFTYVALRMEAGGERHPDQLLQAASVEFFHHAGTVDLDGAGRGTELVRDHFALFAREHQVEHFAILGREERNSATDLFAPCGAIRGVCIAFERPLHGSKQSIARKRLLQ